MYITPTTDNAVQNLYLKARFVTVQDGRNIGRGPYFPGMAMIHDRGHKIFALSFETVRPQSSGFLIGCF
jgi:hypothetical protein